MSKFTYAKLGSDGDMDLNAEIIEVEASWDDEVMLDDDRMLDDDYMLDDDDRVEDLISYITGEDYTWSNIEHFHLKDNDENFYTANFIEDEDANSPMKIDKNGGVIIKGSVSENAL